MPTAPDGTVFESIGIPDAPCIVLIHGLGLNQACWQWTLPAISQGYRILRYDLYGHGASPNPPERPTLSLFSRQLQGLLDFCEVANACIIGFSLGGMIARRFAQDVPDRTRALAILHSAHKRSPQAQTAIQARVEQARTIGPKATVEAALDRWFTDEFRTRHPDVMETVRGWVMANRTEVYHEIYQVLADGVEEIITPKPALSCPTLVITGDEDFGNNPQMSRAIAKDIDGARVVILPRLRHMALAEDPQAINAPLRQFLDCLDEGKTP